MQIVGFHRSDFIMFSPNPSFIGVFLLGTMSNWASAETLTSNFNVAILIKPKCIINTPTIDDIDFNTHDTTDTHILGSTSFAVTCTKNTPYSIGLTPSNAQPDGEGLMQSDTPSITDTIAYALFKDAGLNEPWGNQGGSGGNQMDVPAGTAGLTDPVTHTVYARVASVGNITPGNYRDRVTLTITY